jgi:Zn-dependent protease with chaperone function
MAKALDYQVEPKENIYFAICLVISLLVYTGIILGIMAGMEFGKGPFIAVFGLYALIVIVALHVIRGVLVGYIRGNAIKLGPHQFPEIHQVVMSQSQALGLSRIPDVFLLQQGGLLNAFATRFMGSDYVVLYSDLMEEAYEKNQETVDFVIAHELGHIKRNHILKRIIILPAMMVPFLGYAYSRACEYTCDSIGASLSPTGVRSGLLVLAAGKRLYRQVDAHYFIEQRYTESGFWTWFAEKLSTHPHLTKRLARFANTAVFAEKPQAAKNNGWDVPPTQAAKEEVKKEPVNDPSKYMPK